MRLAGRMAPGRAATAVGHLVMARRPKRSALRYDVEAWALRPGISLGTPVVSAVSGQAMTSPAEDADGVAVLPCDRESRAGGAWASRLEPQPASETALMGGRQRKATMI